MILKKNYLLSKIWKIEHVKKILTANVRYRWDPNPEEKLSPSRLKITFY